MTDYTTIADVKAAMSGASWDSTTDTLLTALVTRASRAIDRFAGREPGAYAVSADTTRYFDGSGLREQRIGEIAAAPTSVALSTTGSIQPSDYLTLASTDYYPWPYNAAAEGQPYLRLDMDPFKSSYLVWWRFPRSVKVVGKFGYSTAVPDELVQATITQVGRWYRRGLQAFADAGAIATLDKIQYVRKLDPDVENLIQHFRKLAI